MRPLLALLLSLFAIAVPAATAAAADDRPVYRVVVFGDSYGAGDGAPGTPGSYDSDGTDGNPRAVWSGSTSSSPACPTRSRATSAAARR